MSISVLCTMLLSFILLILCVNAAVMHSHSHTTNVHKEREVDGAYSPRDHTHYSDGEHYSEFDHEAIIGKAAMKNKENVDELKKTF